MSRDARAAAIPAGLMVVLWGSVAAWVHFGVGVTGYEVAVAHDDKRAMVELSEKVRDRVASSEQTFDVGSTGGLAPVATVEPTPPPPTPPPLPSAKKPDIKPAPVPSVAKKPDPPKEDKKVVVAVKKADNPPLVNPPQPKPDKRIAVRQHVTPNQDDNPNARFIGDEANHVTDESVATLTSHDRDDVNPTPAGNHQNADKSPGDSENTKIAESDEHKGDRNRAPGEHGTEFDIQHDPPPDHMMAPIAVQGPISAQAPRTGGDGRIAATTPNAPPVDPAGAAAPTAPDVVSGPAGGWSFSLVNPNAGTGDSANGGPGSASRVLQQQGAPSERMFGLGGNPGPGRVNLNLTQQGVIAAVGQDQLRKEREADGERRKSDHRGSWQASNFERWRSAIDNYVSSVKPGNQTALNTAAVPFATYLNGMHNRIHPIFADTFLGSLESLPASHVLSDQKLMTRLEIVLSRDGHLIKMGIVKTSGVTAFDIAALDSVQRASPFGPAPGAIVSPDGQVYLHWEFHRDEVYACSTMNARPYILNVPSGAPPVEPNTPPTNDPGNKGLERTAPPSGDTRQGLLALPNVTPHG
jgi:TonB family protein